MTDHVIQFSGGVGSWATGRIVTDEIAERDDTIWLLFADTLIEDEETYLFLQAAADNLGLPLTRLADGRTPWELFADEKFLGNTRVDICSRVLKRDLLRKYIEQNFDPDMAIIYFGIDWTEVHRLERAQDRWHPWKIDAPLVRTSYTKADLLAWAQREGLPEQRLYKMGMPHANCGGGCVKAGQGHFAKLLEVFPERFAEWEQNEERLRQQLGDVAILRDRRGGTTTPLPLSELRHRIEEGGRQSSLIDWNEFGGCGCAID